MQLPDQLLKKVRILTDKPISPILNKQLLPLILHQNLEIQKTVPLLCQKYRSDLLIHLLTNNRFPSENTINNMLISIENNILSYKLSQLLQLYILVLGNYEQDKKLLQIGYYDLIKLAIKLPNLEVKERLFQILVSNFQYFYKRKSKKVIMAIVANYIDVFSKFLIYVPSYINLAQLILDVDKKSKQIINKDHPQRQPQLQQIFIDLSSKQLSMFSNQILTTLENTKDKLNYYTLHRNCLNALKKLGDLINDFKIKESQLNFTEIDVGKIVRTIQIFQDRKGTIDEARFAKAPWIKRLNNLKKIKELKGEKIMDRQFEGPLYLDKKQAEKPLLIEDVISMANNYRLKYQVCPSQNEQSSRIVSVTNNFLRKGIGIGGGKTYLLNEKHQNIFRQQKTKNKRLYDDLLDKCFSQCQKDLQYKSFVDPKFIHQDSQQKVGNNEDSGWNVRQPVGLSLQNSKIWLEEVENLPIFIGDGRMRAEENEEQLGMSKQSSIFQEDEQIEEINNLIQLAYSYKFT